MRGIVLRILTEIFIIVLNEILKNLSKEVILLLKYTFKAAVCNLIDYCTTKTILLFIFNNILRNAVKQTYLRLSTGSYRELNAAISFSVLSKSMWNFSSFL